VKKENNQGYSSEMQAKIVQMEKELKKFTNAQAAVQKTLAMGMVYPPYKIIYGNHTTLDY
jgi:hypothetical protein